MLLKIKSIIEGMFTVFKHLFKKPVTLEYPEKRKELNQYYRGKLVVKGCVGCGMCQKVCPAGAISLKKNTEDKVESCIVDLKKCIFCGNCTYYCAKGAIRLSKEYELATDNKDDLMLIYKNEGECANDY